TLYSVGKGAERKGMDPTRAFMDSILKYKCHYNRETKRPNKKFLYEDQGKHLDFVHPPELRTSSESWDTLRSIECQIMNWADDVAYSVHDLKDAITAGFITPLSIGEWKERKELGPDDQSLLAELEKSIRDGSFERSLGH